MLVKPKAESFKTRLLHLLIDHPFREYMNLIFENSSLECLITRGSISRNSRVTPVDVCNG